MKIKTVKLGTHAGDRALRAWEERSLDPESSIYQPRHRRVRDYDPDDYDREATDYEYDRIADQYERRIYGE